MVFHCHFCTKQFTPEDGARPVKILRNRYSCWEEPQTRHKVLRICGPCSEKKNTADFMAETLPDNLLEWVTFVFVRSTLTDLTTAGITMNDAIVQLKGRLVGSETKLRVLRGLEVLKRNDQARNQKIYDPFFRDPCSNSMVVELRIFFAQNEFAAVWFLSVCAVMRLNRNLAQQYSCLWMAES